MEVLSQLHLLEQVSSTEYIGSLTESLLKVLDEEEVVKKVHTYSWSRQLDLYFNFSPFWSLSTGSRTLLFVGGGRKRSYKGQEISESNGNEGEDAEGVWNAS